MKLAVIAITRNGTKTAKRVCDVLQADLYIKQKFEAEFGINNVNSLIFNEFSETVNKLFQTYDGIIFIMAVGIVVRSISPYLTDKQSDPAVVVMDEAGRFSISLLSGHIGGANKLCREAASAVGAVPVITTSTDINNVTAFDELAVKNDLVIENIGNLKFISSALVNGGRVSVYSDIKTTGYFKGNVDLENSENQNAVVISNKQNIHVTAEKILYLRPRNIVLGIGCRKGKSSFEIEEAILDFLGRNNICVLSLRAIASVSIKKDEKGIKEFCSNSGIPFITYDPEELLEAEKYFEVSDFVKNTVGVGNVCETSAYKASISGRIVCSKTIYNGITLALAEDEKVINL